MTETTDTRRSPAAAASRLPPASVYWVAFSGGVDSHVLLHVLAAHRAAFAPAGLRAVHIDHGLRSESAEWARHCDDVCRELGVECVQLRVAAAPRKGESPEDAARRARYEALQELIGPDDCLLTAHHQDDQAETLLLQLLRGAGPRGLAAMPAHSPFGPGILARPLLGFTREELLHYARTHGLLWVDDASNAELSFDRNYLRHEILPLLRTRWPAATRTLARSAAHCAEAAELLDELARADLARVRGTHSATLRLAELAALPAPRQRLCMRAWIESLGLPTPSLVHVQRALREFVEARPDRNPCVHWPGTELRRYRGLLYAMTPAPAHDAGASLPWNLRDALMLPAAGGRLEAIPATDGGLRRSALADGELTVRFRRGGEQCAPAGRGHTHALKNLLQEAGVLPWWRARVPLLYVGERLAAVADLWICEPFAAAAGEEAVRLRWRANLGEQACALADPPAPSP